MSQENQQDKKDTTHATQLDALKKKQTQLQARIQKMEASEKTRERKRETRRKILIGAYFLKQARETGQFDDLVAKMADTLKRPTDRVLFDLPPLDAKLKDNPHPETPE